MWVRSLKNGKVRYCERYADSFTGKYKDVSITYEKDTPRNRKEAARLLAEKIQAKQARPAGALTLAQLVSEYRNDQKITVRKSTYDRNHSAMNTIMQMLGADVLISRLTSRYVRQRFLASARPAGALNELLKRFKAMWRWAYKNDLASSTTLIDKIEPFKDVPRAAKVTDKYLEPWELATLLDGMSNREHKLAALFLVLTGLRVGEFSALEKADVNLTTGYITVNKNYDANNKIVVPTKTQASTGEVYIQSQLLPVINDINKLMAENQIKYGYRSSLFFAGHDGGHFHYFAFNKYLKENSERILGRRITAHALRHTHATLLYAAGFSFSEVGRRLRHGTNARVTQEIYIHVSQQLKERDAEKLRQVVLF